MPFPQNGKDIRGERKRGLVVAAKQILNLASMIVAEWAESRCGSRLVVLGKRITIVSGECNSITPLVRAFRFLPSQR